VFISLIWYPEFCPELQTSLSCRDAFLSNITEEIFDEAVGWKFYCESYRKNSFSVARSAKPHPENPTQLGRGVE